MGETMHYSITTSTYFVHQRVLKYYSRCPRPIASSLTIGMIFSLSTNNSYPLSQLTFEYSGSALLSKLPTVKANRHTY